MFITVTEERDSALLTVDSTQANLATVSAEKDAALAERLFADLSQSGGRFDTLILFWLGEPLIHPHFGRIWRAAMRAADQHV